MAKKKFDLINSSFDGIINLIVVISVVASIIGCYYLGDDFGLFGFAICFTNFPILFFSESLFPLLHFTIGEAILMVLYINKVREAYSVVLSDPDNFLYVKIAIPLIMVAVIYVLIILGRVTNKKYLTIAKVLHLILLVILGVFLFV